VSFEHLQIRLLELQQIRTLRQQHPLYASNTHFTSQQRRTYIRCPLTSWISGPRVKLEKSEDVKLTLAKYSLLRVLDTRHTHDTRLGCFKHVVC
jgi:hypothetical protein